jgi:two-component system chemotaxis response regulator CheY
MVEDGASKHCAVLVDDDAEAREIVRQFLVQFGFSRVLEATNGAEALDVLESRYQGVTLVVSDWQMPGMSGIELRGKLFEKPWLARLPFVIMTAATPSEPWKALQAADLGVSGYLLKPFNSKAFHSQMDCILQDLQKSRQAEACLVTGRILLALGEAFQAESVFKDGTSRFPQEALLWEAMGDSLALRSREAKGLSPAYDAYEKALRLNPARSQVAMKYFDTACLLGRMNDAVRMLHSHLRHSDLEQLLRRGAPPTKKAA